MILLGNLMLAIAEVLHAVINFFYFILLAQVILSWVSPDPRNPIVSFIYQATEPVLRKVRGKVPPLGMIDLSPIVVFLGLLFLDRFLVNSLAGYGAHFIGMAAIQLS